MAAPEADQRARAAPDEVRALAHEAAHLARDELGDDLRVLWFGSWVEGTAVPRSDVDLALDAGTAIPPTRMARLRERVEALPTLRRVDLLDLSELGAQRRARIEAGAVSL